MTNFQLEACIEKYGKDIYSFCRYLTQDKQNADDLYQETFLKAIELEKSLDDKINPRSYLLSIAVRLWKNKKRKFAWRKRIADFKSMDEGDEFQSLQQDGDSPEDLIINREKVLVIRAAVDRLPERLKLIVVLHYMEDMTVAQISQIVRIPEGTVKSRLYKARNLLKAELEDVLNEK